ncbi:MAG TPA: glucosyl-3-phosphoglycerate synthase [Pseudonocardiaceae bacterium]|jgi:glucosyl-3-phosphoglycerate synthase|nr:glucosyl-3-phosphoglycerate synthase [Pseudonocardiaceae bacterium]
MDAQARSWFEACTSDAADWPLDGLLAGKGDQRVAVVIPARDEQPTIGTIVSVIRRALMDDAALVDELVVLDSRSTDDTAAVAAAAGAQVYAVDDIRPDLGCHAGKGEAIWKSQFVTTADIVVLIDGDLTQWGPHFVTGLLGPVFADENVLLCKGFYDRSFADASGVSGTAGGRVTELVARPMINISWPELAAVVQPLGGEWAMRSSLLRSLRIPVGYGVEFGTLVDTWALHGLGSIAQVDLGSRGHSHQGMPELGAMAAEIMQVAGHRLGLSTRSSGAIAQFDRDVPGHWVDRPVPSVEREPAQIHLQSVG